MNNLIDKIRANAPEHASIPFWSWNACLEDKELIRQIQHMKSLGMRGFFMHARGGLETEYMSDAWFHAVRVCIREAERLGMEAWAYDENGWPSGFAGGELLKDPENQACGLTYEILPDFPKTTDENVLGIYTLRNKRIQKHTASCGAEQYIIIRRKRDFSYVDTMNPRVTRQFLSLVHEKYLKELGSDLFGKQLRGFFTDEPQYFRYGTPWSDTFPKTFRERFGYDVSDALPALFFDFRGAEELRYDYHLHCHESFYRNFMKIVFDWCGEHGVQLTGHGIEEWGLGGQMMCCGGIMPFYLYEHIPGIDYLGRGIKNISGAKQLGSVCAQTGKKIALSEMFACCGWDVTPKELKRIAELQFAGGVNLICEHLYPYSERGQRKRDFPNHYSDVNPWSKYFGFFERYFQNLGSALSQGREIADTLVIHPIRSAYFRYKHTIHSVSNGIVTNDSSGIAALEQQFETVVNLFSELQIPYHFGDETVMKQLNSRAEGPCIRVGNCKYDKVVLPNCECLDSYTVSILKTYVKNGGKLIILGNQPERIDGRIDDLSFLKSNFTLSELRAESGVRVEQNGKNIPLHLQIRSVNGGRLLFLANPSATEYRHVEIRVSHCSGLEELDIETLQFKPLRGRTDSDGSVTVFYDFADSDSCLLVEKETSLLPVVRSDRRSFLPVNLRFQLKGPCENQLVLDQAKLSTNGGIAFSELRPIARIRDNLLSEHHVGPCVLRFCFEIADLVPDLRLVVEPINGMTVSVNGAACRCLKNEWRMDRDFLVYHISKMVKRGCNTVDLSFCYRQREGVYDVLYGGGNEALRNCLAFDTEIEAVYLYGNFRVKSKTDFKQTQAGILHSDGPFVLCRQTEEVDLTDIVKSGYPFFAGEMKATAEFSYHVGDPTIIKIGGRYAVCRLAINGVDLETRLFSDLYELKPYLKNGGNRMSVKLCFSNRNLLGSHHWKEAEPLFVTPRTFSFEKLWKGGKCAEYQNGYSFVQFGTTMNQVVER